VSLGCRGRGSTITCLYERQAISTGPATCSDWDQDKEMFICEAGHNHCIRGTSAEPITETEVGLDGFDRLKKPMNVNLRLDETDERSVKSDHLRLAADRSLFN
jgi:hypothetical protein